MAYSYIRLNFRIPVHCFLAIFVSQESNMLMVLVNLDGLQVITVYLTAVQIKFFFFFLLTHKFFHTIYTNFGMIRTRAENIK